jgi:hypothetical protein
MLFCMGGCSPAPEGFQCWQFPDSSMEEMLWKVLQLGAIRSTLSESTSHSSSLKNTCYMLDIYTAF